MPPGFMDPIFSAGVYLAMQSGKLAAEAVIASLAAGDDGARRFAAYERRVHRAMKFYWNMVEGFYTTPFMELFMEPRDKFNMPAAITALLAGEVEGGWRIQWRLWIFFCSSGFRRSLRSFPGLRSRKFRPPFMRRSAPIHTKSAIRH
jgi:hypothetical protein